VKILRGKPDPRVVAPVFAFVLAAGAAGLLLPSIDAVFGTVLAAVTLFIAAVDLDRFEIPDLGNLFLLVLGLAWTLEVSEFSMEAFAQGLLRSLVAGGVMLTVHYVYRIARGFDGLGLGDVKLAGAGAPWLWWSHLAVTLLIAVGAAIAVLVGRSVVSGQRVDAHAAVPLGAFLAPAIWITWFAQALASP